VYNRNVIRAGGGLLFLCIAATCVAQTEYSAGEAQAFVKQYCAGCHRGRSPAGKLDLTRSGVMKGPAGDPETWIKMVERVRDSVMPPSGALAPEKMVRESFVSWADQAVRTAVCGSGPLPGPARMRRLNRNEYAATMRDLLNIHFNAGHALPADGAGGEGFDNAAETLFISPLHAEKYLEAAKQALAYGAKDPRSRAAFLIAQPGPETTPEQAAQKILERFLPRAFRRPAAPGEFEEYMALFRAAQKRNQNFDESILYALQGVLISPYFLFRVEEPNAARAPREVSSYEMASRLSYFLWASMPDQQLFDLAAKDALRDAAVLTEQVARMLKDAKTRDFAEQFVEQWLGTRELGRDIKPDEKLFPEYYDAELQSAIRHEPFLFFQELLAGDLSLLNLLDSKFTILNNKLQRHYRLEVKGTNQQPKRIDLPEGSRRGGLLGMAAVHAVSSYPHRTSPVLRGKWILESLLGTPPPPPPPNVPELDQQQAVEPRTLREKLELHRRNAACAACHARIDPLGFALENYDVLGRWREEEAGKPIDTRGQLPDGTQLEGPGQLKAALLDRKEIVMRNLAGKMLAYALGRGLNLEDSCTVDHIMDELARNDYRAQTLIRAIVLSVPFRYRAGTDPRAPVMEYSQEK
jgi:hypothetical protein